MPMRDNIKATSPQSSDLLRSKLESFRDSPSDGSLFRELRTELRARDLHETLAELSELRAPHEREPARAAEIWAEAAEGWLSVRKLKQAERAWRKSLAQDPAHEQSARNLSDQLIAARRYAEAADVIEDELAELVHRDEELAARDGSGQRPPHTLRRAERHRVLARLWQEHLGRVDRALNHWQQAWQLQPERTEALEAARSIYASLGDEKMVARLYEAELELVGQTGPTKRRAEVALELGRIAARRGDGQAAAGYFERALELNPDSMAARDALAEVYASSEIPERTDRHQRASSLFVELGEHSIDIHNEESGISYLRRALGVDPYSREATQALERALVSAERWDELDRLYQHRYMLTDSPAERAEILNKRADLYQSQIPSRTALKEVLIQLSAQSPPHGAISQRLRDLYREDGEWAALASHIEQELPAIRTDKRRTCVELLELATIVREHLGNRDRAAELLHHILQEIDPHNEEALARYGEHFRERRDWRGLADLLDFAVDSARDAGAETSELIRRLEEIAQIAEVRLGDIDRAVSTWRRIQDLEPDSKKPQEAIRRLLQQAKKWESLVGVLEQEAEAAQTPELRADALRRIAQVYRERQVNPRRAIALYEEVVSLFPDDRGALKGLAELYERDMDNAGLAKTVRRQLDLESRVMTEVSGQPVSARDWPVAKRAERLTALRRLVSMYERLSDTEGVVFTCTGILDILPGDRDALDRMERALEEAGDLDRLEQTLEYHASSASGPAERAKVLRRLARIALLKDDELHAMERWEQVLKAAPYDAEALENLADLYERHNRFGELATVLERLLMPQRSRGTQTGVRRPRAPAEAAGRVVSDPSLTLPTKRVYKRATTAPGDATDAGERIAESGPIQDLSARLGQLKRYAKVVQDKLEDATRATRAWQQVIDLAPKDREALVALAALHGEHGRFGELAEILALQASLYARSDPMAAAQMVLKRAHILEHRLGAPSDAAKALECLIAELDPANVDAHKALRRLYESRGDFEAAVRIAEREMYLASETEEKIARGLEIGLLCRDRLGDPARALQAFERVLALRGEHDEALLAAADLYARVEDWPNHIRMLERRIELLPEGRERRELMTAIAQVIAERLGDHAEAFRWYRKAHEHDPDSSTMADLRRAAEAYGLWSELAEVYDEERQRLGGDGQVADRRAYVVACRELAAIAERRLSDQKRAMSVLYDAIAVAPRDPRLMAEVERLALEADDRALWMMLLECYQAGIAGADRPGKVALHGRRARILEERLGDSEGAMEELLKAFAWAPERDEIRKVLYDLASRSGQWSDVVAVESALLERAPTPAALIHILRRKAAVLEDKLGDVARAFRTHLIAFLMAPEDSDTVGHLWRLARSAGSGYREADKTPRPEPSPAYVHAPEQVRARPAPQPPPPPAKEAPLEIRSSSKRVRADATIDLTASDLRAVMTSGDQAAAPPSRRRARTDHTIQLDITDLVADDLADALADDLPDALADDLPDALANDLDDDLDDVIEIEETRPARPPRSDPTIELRPEDLIHALGGKRGAAPQKLPPQKAALQKPPPFLPGVSPGTSRRPPPPPSRQQPPPVQLAPVRRALAVQAPHMPVRPYESPWDELATAYDILAAPSTDIKLRWLFRIAEIWETGAQDVNRAFHTLARALKVSADDTEARARLQRLAAENDAWDRLAELYETAAEEAKTAARAVSLFMDVAEIRARQHRARETEAIYRRVLGMRPDDLVARQRLESLYRAEGRWVDLAASLEERTDPRLGTAAPVNERPELLRELADIYCKQLSRPHDAIDALLRLRSLIPEDVSVLGELAQLYGQVGRWSKVIEMLGRVSEVAEGSSEARAALRRIAQIYQTELELPDRAISAYSQLLSSWPDDTEAHAALDKLYEAHARWKELADILRRRAALTRDSLQRSKLLRRRAAVLLERLGAPEEAAATLRHARTITPDAPGLADELVLALIAAKREREAAAVLESRITAHLDVSRQAGPGDGSTGDIAGLLIRLAMLKAEHLGDIDGAKETLERALEMVPDHPTALAALAKLIESEEDPRTYAEARLREAEALTDVDAKVDALMKAGLALRDRVEDIGAARAAFEHVLRVRPYHPDATWALAGLVEQGGDPHQAAQVLQTRLEDQTLDSGEKARIMTQLAALARQGGVDAAAERHLAMALEAEPTHEPAIIALADLLSESQRFEDLEKLLREVLPRLEDKAEPVTLAELHRRLAMAYEQLGRDDDAYQTLLSADKLHRGHILVKLAMGENRYRARRWREAALHLGSLAMHVDAKSHPAEVAEGLFHAALAEIRSLRPEKAKPLYERALDLKPNYPPALHVLAEMAMEEGDYKKAADLLTRQAMATDEPAERMRLFEALGDMALGTLRDHERALVCYEAAVNAASPLESRHLPLLEKLYGRQEQAGDARGAARIAELMASFGTDASQRAMRYTQAAEHYLSMRDRERATAAAQRAVEAEPYDLMAVHVLSDLLMKAGQIEEASAVLSRALSGPDQTDDEFTAARKSQLWNRLAHARRARGDIKGAAAAWEKSVAIAPDSDGAMASRRELLEVLKDEPQKRETLLEFRRVLAADSMDLKDVVTYARALCQAKHDDGGRAILELAEVMGHKLNKLDQAFLERRPVYRMAPDEAYRKVLSTEERASIIPDPRHPDEPESLLGRIFAAIWEDAASLLWPDAEEALARAGVGGATRVSAFSKLSAVAILPRVSQALAAPATVVYGTEVPDAPDVQVLCVSTPVVVLGPRLQGLDGQVPPGAELRFILGRAAELTRPEHVIATGLPRADLDNLLASILRSFGPKGLRKALRGHIHDEDVQRAHDEVLRTTLPVKLRTTLEELLQDAGTSDLDISRYLTCVHRAADRAGLLLSGSITTALAHAGLMSPDGRRITRHLIEAALRPSYLKIRQQLGSGVR